MSETKSKSSNFLAQGSILAVASIISRFIGLLYRIPLNRILGTMGCNYYGTAFEIYNILLIISSYSLPLAVSKLVSASVAKHQRRKAYQIFKASMLFACTTGLIASLIVFFGAEWLANIQKSAGCAIALRYLGPALFIVAVLGVIRGFFQGLGTMVPSAISQILEQIVNAIVSVYAAYVLFNYGQRIGDVLNNTDLRYQWAAGGGTIGTLSGSVMALVFMIIVFVIYMKLFKKQMRRERNVQVDSFKYIMYTIVITIVPVLLSTTIYNINGTIDNTIYKRIALLQGYGEEEIGNWYGIYTGYYKILINLPISIASALAASTVPSLTASYTAKDMEAVRGKINSSMRFIMVVAAPCAVGLAVLANPILGLLFDCEANSMASVMLWIGAISVIFYAISTLSNGILQGLDRMRVPVINASIALVTHLIVLAILMIFFRLHIYAVVLANAFFGALMCYLNATSVKRYSGYKQEVLKTFVIPIACSLIMGIICLIVYQGLLMLTGFVFVAFVIAFVVAVITYAVSILLLKGIEENEILNFPMGSVLVKIFKKLHLLR